MRNFLLSEADLIASATALGARQVRAIARPEKVLLDSAKAIPDELLTRLAAAINSGQDPLGDAFCRLRTPEARRSSGATFTPRAIVSSMTRWARGVGVPIRVVDGGTGSGRFLLAAGKAFPKAFLVGYETDPLAALLARANLATCGFADRTEIIVEDYRNAKLPIVPGPTLFIGNPPYVRHHQIDTKWKGWLTSTATRLGYRASQLAGLYVHFFLATVAHARSGDYGAFVTAAEWLDVNYGALVRQMFLDKLGGQFITVIEPTARAFEDAATTAAITGFTIDARPKTVRLCRVSDVSKLGSLAEGREIHRGRLETAGRWSHLTRKTRAVPEGYVELGELCRVHRGQVTGANRVWIAGRHSVGIPERFLFRTITRARELFAAGLALTDSSHLRDVIDLPADLDHLEFDERRQVESFLRYAEKAGAHKTYIATNRKAWWSVGLRVPAPILATYMARRPPAFVRNLAGARHLNIAHGLYPREPLAQPLLDRLASYLSGAVSVTEGRTYQGGLTKFEPREMERLFVPGPDLLRIPTI